MSPKNLFPILLLILFFFNVTLAVITLSSHGRISDSLSICIAVYCAASLLSIQIRCKDD